MPAAEVEIDADLVRTLLREQCSQFADLDVVVLAHGWDNVLYRLGHEFVVRLPRRELAVPLVVNEQRWLPQLAPLLPLPVPAPVFAGVAGAGYPWPWTIVPWLPGEPALHAPPRDLDAAARALGDFVRALHSVPVPDDPPANPWRGVPLSMRDEVTRNCIDSPEVLERWKEALRLPEWTGPRVWLHGDLHPGNVLVDAGAISAVIDFGDITAGDAATDLFLAWAMFPPDAREIYRAAVGVDDETWSRGRAWALAFGAVVKANSADNPAYHHLGQRMLDAVLADF